MATEHFFHAIVRTGAKIKNKICWWKKQTKCKSVHRYGLFSISGYFLAYWTTVAVEMGHWSHYRRHSFCPSNPKGNHTPISQRSQLRPKEVKQFSQGHTSHAVWPWRSLSFISYYLSEEPACFLYYIKKKKKNLDLVKSLYYGSLWVSSFQSILKDQYFWQASIINYKGDRWAKGLWRLNVAWHHLWGSHQESLNNLGSEPFWKGAQQTSLPRKPGLFIQGWVSRRSQGRALPEVCRRMWRQERLMFMLRLRETSHSELETGPRPNTKYSHNWSLPK